MLDECRQKTFAVERATDGTAQQHAGAVGKTVQINFGGGNCVTRSEPAQAIASRTAQWSTQFTEVTVNFSRENLPVARRFEERQRFQSAFALDDGVPDLVHATTRRGHNAKAGDD